MNELKENWLGELFWFIFLISFVLILLDFFGIFASSVYAGFSTMLLMLFFLKSGLFNNLFYLNEKVGGQK